MSLKCKISHSYGAITGPHSFRVDYRSRHSVRSLLRPCQSPAAHTERTIICRSTPRGPTTWQTDRKSPGSQMINAAPEQNLYLERCESLCSCRVCQKGKSVSDRTFFCCGDARAMKEFCPAKTENHSSPVFVLAKESQDWYSNLIVKGS